MIGELKVHPNAQAIELMEDMNPIPHKALSLLFNSSIVCVQFSG